MKHKKTEIVERNVQQPTKAFSILEEGDNQNLFSALLGSCNNAIRINDPDSLMGMPEVIQNCYNDGKIFTDPIIMCSTCDVLGKVQELNALLKEDIEQLKTAIGAENVRQAIMRFGDDFINIVTESLNLQQSKMEYNTISCALAVLKAAGFEVQLSSNNRIINRYNHTLGFEFRGFWNQSNKMPTHKNYIASNLFNSNSINQATMGLYNDFMHSVMNDFIMRYPGTNVNIISELTHAVFLSYHDSLLDMASIVDELTVMILLDEELCKFLSKRARYRDDYDYEYGEF